MTLETIRVLTTQWKAAYERGELDAFKFVLKECQDSPDVPEWLIGWLGTIIGMKEKSLTPPPEIPGICWEDIKPV